MAEILNGKQLQGAVLNGKQLFACVKNGRISYLRKPAVRLTLSGINAGEVITINRSFVGGQVIDWGDGSLNRLTTHTYSNSGNYNVSIYANYTTIPDNFLATNIASKISYLFITSQIQTLGYQAFYTLASGATVEFESLCYDVGRNFIGINNLTVNGLENLTYIGYTSFANSYFTRDLLFGRNLTAFGGWVCCNEFDMLNVRIEFFMCQNLEEIGINAFLATRTYDWYGRDLDFRHTKLKKIGTGAFMNNINIKTLTLPDTYTEWGWDDVWANSPVPFQQTNFDSIVLSRRTQMILMDSPSRRNQSAFAWACKYILDSPMPPRTNNGYMIANPDAKIYVPDSALDRYVTAEGWRDITSQLYPMSRL